jgi:peptidoglycan/xylan/chitin deacetylase (PgdA/CDA1 family)
MEHRLLHALRRIVRRSLRFVAPFTPTETPVLAYHSVDESGSLLSIRPSAFREHLTHMRAENWESLSVADYAAQPPGRGAGKRRVLITFDDGYRNFYDRAFPLLKEFGFKATVFVPVDFVGKKPLWFERDEGLTRPMLDHLALSGAERLTLEHTMASQLSEPLMSWSQLSELVASGIDIQSHSAGHAFLPILPAPQLAEDLSRSRRVLEDRLGQPVHAIAYPYGGCNAAVARAAREAGFSTGFILDHGARDQLGMMRWRAGIGGQATYAELRSIMLSWPLHARVRHLLGRGPAAQQRMLSKQKLLADQAESIAPARLR